jgi:hypothetical protein
MIARSIVPAATAASLYSLLGSEGPNCKGVTLIPATTGISVGDAAAQLALPTADIAYQFPVTSLNNIYLKGNASDACLVFVF